MTAPETVHEAQQWTLVKNKAHEHGLCHDCAAQFAWGIQNGFATIHPPCAACAPIVADWPMERVNGWRKPIGNVSRPPAWEGRDDRTGGWHRKAVTR